MLVFEITSPLTFHTEVRHSGYRDQQDLQLVATRDGQYVGHIDYAVWQDEVSVQMISVPESQRRKGIGTALVRELQRQYPDVEINMGMLTDDGSKLLATIPRRIVPNDEYQRLATRLAKLQRIDAAWKKKADMIAAQSTDAGRTWFQSVMDKWNAIYDEIYQIEKRMQDLRPSTKLFV